MGRCEFCRVYGGQLHDPRCPLRAEQEREIEEWNRPRTEAGEPSPVQGDGGRQEEEESRC